MAKHAKKSDHLQIVESPNVFVEVPLPLLGALTSTRNAFFELCVDAGRQVLDAMMEQDREHLCGPLWKRTVFKKFWPDIEEEIEGWEILAKSPIGPRTRGRIGPCSVHPSAALCRFLQGRERKFPLLLALP